jgi:hypothetical protein
VKKLYAPACQCGALHHAKLGTGIDPWSAARDELAAVLLLWWSAQNLRDYCRISVASMCSKWTRFDLHTYLCRHHTMVVVCIAWCT